LTIKEVAVRVGVNDISHFVRDYKALFGQTPSEARRLSRGKWIHNTEDSHLGQ
jgi:AraC-like DNA-binding protein